MTRGRYPYLGRYGVIYPSADRLLTTFSSTQICAGNRNGHGYLLSLDTACESEKPWQHGGIVTMRPFILTFCIWRFSGTVFKLHEHRLARGAIGFATLSERGGGATVVEAGSDWAGAPSSYSRCRSNQYSMKQDVTAYTECST